jgi:hypothetical protein
MAIETKCQTSGALFTSTITQNGLEFSLTLPFGITLSLEEAELLEANLHNVVEIAYAKHFVPKYTHDCDACTFLGPYTYDAPMVEGTEEITADLWYCSTAAGGPTLIARFSSDGPDYGSCPINIVERDYIPRAERGEKQSTAGPAIVEAYHRMKRAEKA